MLSDLVEEVIVGRNQKDKECICVLLDADNPPIGRLELKAGSCLKLMPYVSDADSGACIFAERVVLRFDFIQGYHRAVVNNAEVNAGSAAFRKSKRQDFAD